MSELLQYMQVGELTLKVVVFFFCGAGGMVVAYTQRWARSESGLTWWQYMTGDGQSTASALIKLITACWITGGFDYLSALSLQAVINGGILLGLSMPDKIDEEKAKQKILDGLPKNAANSEPI